MDASNIDSTLMTATFVSLAHLNFDTCVENLAPLCLSVNAPQDFKIAVVSACSHEYQPLFVKVAEFVRTQLKVCLPHLIRFGLIKKGHCNSTTGILPGRAVHHP